MHEIKKRKLVPYILKDIVDIESISTMYIYNLHETYTGFEESHKELEFIYVAEGSVTTKEEGVEYVLNKGQMFLHKQYAVHIDRTNNVASKIFIFTFRFTNFNFIAIFIY